MENVKTAPKKESKKTTKSTDSKTSAKKNENVVEKVITAPKVAKAKTVSAPVATAPSAANIVRPDRTLLTSVGYNTASIEDVKRFIPAAFATHESPKLSKRYSFVPTSDLLTAFEKLNWTPDYVRQNGAGDFSRHMIRLANKDLGLIDLRGDKVKPQIILDNSHNGSSPAQLHLGLFRLVCSNGLVVAMPGMTTSVKLRHVGIRMDELQKIMEEIADQYSVIGKHIGKMQKVILSPEQKEEFTIKAIAAREPHVFIKEDGTIDMAKATKIINPSEVMTPVRAEDNKKDLWTIFNIVQERLVKGEFERHTMTGRRTKPRGINNATRHLEFNRTLWEIVESYMTPKAEVVG